MSIRYSSALKVFTIGVLVAGTFGPPAFARRIAFDSDVIQVYDACSLGDSSCSALTLPFAINSASGQIDKIYIYDVGVVSLGVPLPTTASFSGGLASLGGSYIATGFSDYSTKPGVFVTYVKEGYEDENGDPYFGEFRINWAFDGSPENPGQIWSLELYDLAASSGNPGPRDPLKMGDVRADIGHGSLFEQWGMNYVALEPELPTGALIGWNVANQKYMFEVPQGHDLDENNFSFVLSSIPEPATWTMMLAGFAGAGLALRGCRRRFALP